MNNNIISENTTIKFRVVVDGITLYEAASREAISSYIANLIPETRAKAQVVPITESGQQILLG